MKPGFVSAVAVLFCCAVLAVVGLFGYSRYKAAQASNAAFRSQLQSSPGQASGLGTQMPAELPAHGGPVQPAGH